MNSEQIKHCAFDAMTLFLREHNTGCFLCIEDLAVHAYPRKDVPSGHPACLVITKWQLENGLNPAQWNSLGSALLNRYNKEIACQARQKP